MNRDKHIWEGWTVGDFIDELELTYKFKSFESKFELKNWVKSEQPYYKKHIPEVYNYFLNKSGL
jgi:pterin-4a-carbinolamine dehydratase